MFYRIYFLCTVKRTILLYSAALAVLVFLMKILEYRFFVRDFPMAFYVGVVAVFFTALGVWAGLKLTRTKKVVVVSPEANFSVDEKRLKESGISKREYEVLQLMAQGYSNHEIAEKLFVSLNTIKTHTANLYLKLEAKRRTQAVKHAKERALLP